MLDIVGAAPFAADSPEQIFDVLADALVERGYAVVNDFFTPEVTAALRAEFDHPDCHFKTAGIGRQEEHAIALDIRGDRICWLEGGSAAAATFLAAMEQLRLALNRRLFMGLFDYESHLAYYPVGTFYKKHVDAFKGDSNRVLSTVLYLNPSWSAGDGGELVLYDEATDEVIEQLSPKAGRLVVFLSERFPHQVLPAKRKRYSVAGWYRINSNTMDRVDPPT
ncbi:2OG-Fe(II) oxygenase [Gilvimarinus polysaccharolyticus]|uniref:2OG-Fe(II) oxygenase n=1 Tax=Gilvimarinus polysaccharolyticus TaxID=863921 RepID=UPI0006736B51|nr:2OG-Fe(II) oxygenase [Gilvimarinus polysaccharolyticus]